MSNSSVKTKMKVLGEVILSVLQRTEVILFMLVVQAWRVLNQFLPAPPSAPHAQTGSG